MDIKKLCLSAIWCGLVSPEENNAWFGRSVYLAECLVCLVVSISVGMGPQIGIQKGPLCFAF